jgi:flagellar biosynthesis GTPase FlhF
MTAGILCIWTMVRAAGGKQLGLKGLERMVAMFGMGLGEIEVISEVRGFRVSCGSEDCGEVRKLGAMGTTQAQAELGAAGWGYDADARRWHCARCVRAAADADAAAASEKARKAEAKAAKKAAKAAAAKAAEEAAAAKAAEEAAAAKAAEEAAAAAPPAIEKEAAADANAENYAATDAALAAAGMVEEG